MNSKFQALIKLVKTNNNGVAIIYVALALIALLAFVGLAIDLGYMYVTKTQLQNAADSAALAGAEKVKYIGPGGGNPNDLVQSTARTEAINFANRNQATKQNVAIANDNTNVLSSSNDITVGHWNGTTYTPNATPVNAIQVRPRRTDDAPGGPVSLFFNKIFGWDTMGAAADAVAGLPIRANNFIALCTDTCSGVSTDPANPTVLNPARVYERNPNAPGVTSFAWTSLLNQISSATSISPLICSESPNEDVCNKLIWTTQGQVQSLMKDLESVFNDPTFDRSNKVFSLTNPSKVVAWWTIVPVTQQCNPGNQPTPFLVVKYALVRIVSACDTGGGQPCRPYSTQGCTNAGDIVIDRIACIDCANLSNLSGLKTVLIK